MCVVTALPARQWNECVCVSVSVCDMPGVLFTFLPKAGKYSSITVVVGL